VESRGVDASELLKSHVPRLLIEWWREDPAMPFRNVEGTLAFVDISGFTQMCERLARKGRVGAEEVTDVLDASFTQLLSLAYDDSGGVVKWGGDAVLLLFTGPHHLERACRASYRMRAKLREIGRRLRTSAGLVSLRMSVGIHSGRFDFFLVGGRHRELVITGPAATRTVLMESTATAGDIALSAETAALLDERLLGGRKGEARLLRGSPTGFPLHRSSPVETTAGLDLAAYIPGQILEHLLQGGGEAEHRHVAVAFIEFSGTDTLLERSGPRALWDALDHLMRSVQEAAFEHDVSFHETDISANGGKILLVAGAPKSSGDDDDRMLRTVRAIMDHTYALTVRIGVNDGHVFAGNFGPPYRRAYSIKGDAVNLAARVMAKAAPGQILATGSVLERSRTAFEARALDPFQVKGKKRPVQAHDVGAMQGIKTAGKRAELPLVGRDAELSSFIRGLEDAEAGEGRLFDIVGEPGIGKSRLLRELEGRAAGFRVLSSACDPYKSSTPYHPFRGLLREVIGISGDANALSAGRRLRDQVEVSAPHLRPWLPLLATPLDADVDPTPESDQLEMEFKRARSHQLTAELLTPLLPGPTLVILEDVHWMDEPSSHLLRVIASALPERPWMICVTRREQPTGFIPGEDVPTTIVRPAPLDGRDAAALATAGSEDAPLPPHAIAALAERSGGNPLFLEELVAATQATRSVDALPDSVEALLTAQIDRVPTQDRTLLRFASVLGATFDRGLLDAALATDHPAITPGTWDRLANFLNFDASGTFRFRHALIRDVAYGGLSFRRRREVHGRVAETIERSADANAQDQAELLSLHYFQAGRYEKAWRYSRIAGDRAQAKFANVEAADFFIRALDAGRRLGDVAPSELAPVMESLGDVSERAGLYRQAASAYRGARQLSAGDAVGGAALLLKEGLIRERAGRYSDAVAWYRRGLRALDDATLDGPTLAVRARIRVWYASSRRQQGRFLEAIDWCQRAIEDATASGERRALAHAYRMLDRLYTNLGRPERAQYRDLALPIYRELGDLVGESEVLNELGADAYFEGRWTEALDLYRRSTEARRRTGDEVNAAHGTHNIAEILSDQGHLDQAEALFRDVLRIWRASGFRLGIAFATSSLGRVAARAGRHDEAGRWYEEALSAFRAKQAEWEILETQARIAENLVLSGRADQALDLATQTLDRAEKVGGLPVLRAMLHRLRGWGSIERDPASAGRCFDESLQCSMSVNARYETALTLIAQARLAGATGGPFPEDLEKEAWSLLDGLGVVSIAQPPLIAVAAAEG
jgi:predicted ATPase/class 3 adenylate cyclase